MIAERIESLKKDLRNQLISSKDIYKKHFLEVKPYLFEESPHIKNNLLNEICHSFGVNEDSIMLCGSFRTGYSLSPRKLFRRIDEEYDKTKEIKDKSDIDIAIISEVLCKSLKYRIYKYTNGHKNPWKTNEYYNKYKVSNENLNLQFNFYQYNYKGWFRPDYKPPGFDICENGSFEEFKRAILRLTGRKISIAIYEDIFFINDYNEKNIKVLQSKMSQEII